MSDIYQSSQARLEAEERAALERERIREQAYLEERRRSSREQRLFTFKFTQLVWLGVGIVEGLIGLRVLLRLMGANPDNAFAAFIYGFSEVFVLPFEGLTATPSAGGFVLEIHSLIAMLVYSLIGWAIAKTIWVVLYRPRGTS